MPKSANAEVSLTARLTGRAVTKVGVSDPAVCEWKCRRSTDKSRSQGFGCSPIKVVRELGSERRETVRSLSAVGVGYLRGAVPSTRGPEWTHRWRIGCHANGTAEQLCADWINAESI